jgi:hypothetical protein
MNSRRFIALTQKIMRMTIAGQGRASQQKRPLNDRFGSFATKAIEALRPWMSASPPKAYIDRRDRHVRLVPKADSCTAANSISFDHLVGAAEQRQRNRQPKRLSGLEVDSQLEFEGEQSDHSAPTLGDSLT